MDGSAPADRESGRRLVPRVGVAFKERREAKPSPLRKHVQISVRLLTSFSRCISDKTLLIATLSLGVAVVYGLWRRAPFFVMSSNLLPPL